MGRVVVGSALMLTAALVVFASGVLPARASCSRTEADASMQRIAGSFFAGHQRNVISEAPDVIACMTDFVRHSSGHDTYQYLEQLAFVLVFAGIAEKKAPNGSLRRFDEDAQHAHDIMLFLATDPHTPADIRNGANRYLCGENIFKDGKCYRREPPQQTGTAKRGRGGRAEARPLRLNASATATSGTPKGRARYGKRTSHASWPTSSKNSS